MLLIALLVMAGVVWLWWSGKLRGKEMRNLAVTGAGLIALLMVMRGQWLAGISVGLGMAALAQGSYLRWQTKNAVPVDINVSEACALLGLDGNYDEAAVLAAHRRLITQVHPDKGGTADLARRVNAARDILIASLQKRG